MKKNRGMKAKVLRKKMIWPMGCCSEASFTRASMRPKTRTQSSMERMPRRASRRSERAAVSLTKMIPREGVAESEISGKKPPIYGAFAQRSHAPRRGPIPVSQNHFWTISGLGAFPGIP